MDKARPRWGYLLYPVDAPLHPRALAKVLAAWAAKLAERRN
jgi:hypothetical protein